MSDDVKDNVKNYYGKVLQSKNDLKTNACCSTASLPEYLKSILKNIEPEINERFYGCGSPVPLALEGCTVLDLGCGTGRDVYTISQLVGEHGHVIGVDMTEEQLTFARRYQERQAKRFGFTKPNTSFKKGYIENLRAMGIEDNSIDVVVSNCVINLSPDKEAVFGEIFRVLKPGGELYFSDVYADRRIPQTLREDPVLFGECLSGALYAEDFRRILRDLGCLDFRIIAESAIEVNQPELKEKIGLINFCSRTIRAFKIDLEDMCEDYGQVATYKGTMPFAEVSFALDDHHVFEKGKPMLVCGNTADMLSRSRFKKHFVVQGEKTTHYGLFPCDPGTAARYHDSSARCC